MEKPELRVFLSIPNDDVNPSLRMEHWLHVNHGCSIQRWKGIKLAVRGETVVGRVDRHYDSDRNETACVFTPGRIRG